MTRRWPGMFWAMLAACISLPALGESIADLEAAGRLRIVSAIAPGEGIVPGQHVELSLEIATDTWFTSGTRIGIPEIPGLVIVQTEQFAINASESRDGKTWVMQRWTLDIFPQRAGDFTLGPLAVDVQVSAGDEGDVTGTLHSPTQRFSVALPESLAQVKQWVAAPAFTVSQSFDRPLDTLAVGDAFEQEIRFEATDVLAMMLPEYPAPRQAGLAAYPAPPELETSSNRGQILASRSVQISYVVEQPGQFVLPARDFFWWNTQRAQLTLLSVPETRIDVAGEATSQQTLREIASLELWHWLMPVLALALFFTIVRVARRRVSLAVVLTAQMRRLRRLFKPALATRLNPGNNAAE